MRAEFSALSATVLRILNTTRSEKATAERPLCASGRQNGVCELMSASVEKSLELLVNGLRPFVAACVPESILKSPRFANGPLETWDAHSTLAFMWDYWNDFFRSELGFAERSLVSELREIRNRWAHQRLFTTRDTYRVMDNVERLLEAVGSHETAAIRRMRIETMKDLLREECGSGRQKKWWEKFWPYILSGSSAAGIALIVVTFVDGPVAWVISTLVFIAMMRVAWLQSVRENLHFFGPHECSNCGCIIYTGKCPYCAPDEWSRKEVLAVDRLISSPPQIHSKVSETSVPVR